MVKSLFSFGEDECLRRPRQPHRYVSPLDIEWSRLWNSISEVEKLRGMKEFILLLLLSRVFGHRVPTIYLITLFYSRLEIRTEVFCESFTLKE